MKLAAQVAFVGNIFQQWTPSGWILVRRVGLELLPNQERSWPVHPVVVAPTAMTHHCTYRLQLLQLPSTRSWSFALYARLLGSDRLVDFGEMCALRTEAGSVPLLGSALVSVLRLVPALEHPGNFALKNVPIAVHSQCEMSHDTEHDGRHDHMDEPGVNAGHNVIAFRDQRTVLLVSHGSRRPDECDQLVLLVPHHTVAGLSSLAPDTLVALPPGYRCHEEAGLLADFRHGLVQASGRVLRCSADYRVQTPGVLPGLHIVDDVADLANLMRNIMQVIAKSLADDALGARAWVILPPCRQARRRRTWAPPAGPVLASTRSPPVVLVGQLGVYRLQWLRCHRKRSGRTLAPKHAA
ncbi:hypothetical protein V5799_033925 [Amblyomma americanum]|uniref:Uncharacterized protein n=1 Tax=Amblyomma americanum TaxID=6943 RepID=A0AAQ4DLX4_AMBAM